MHPLDAPVKKKVLLKLQTDESQSKMRKIPHRTLVNYWKLLILIEDLEVLSDQESLERKKERVK
jgi:hypothetical protein